MLQARNAMLPRTTPTPLGVVRWHLDVPRVIGRVKCRVGHLDLCRVPRVLGRCSVVQIDGVERRRDLEWKPRRKSLGRPLQGRLRGVCWEDVFTLQTELERPAATGPTHHLLRSHCTIGPNMACADARLAVRENERLCRDSSQPLFPILVERQDP